jgi:hypothetical protein
VPGQVLAERLKALDLEGQVGEVGRHVHRAAGRIILISAVEKVGKAGLEQ